MTRYTATILIAAVALAATGCTRVEVAAPAPAPAPTTTDGFSDQATWNIAALLILGQSETFDGFTDEEILEAVDLVCKTAYVTGDGAVFITAIAIEGGEFSIQVAQILGVLNVPPGCANAAHQPYIEQAIRYLEDF